MSFQFDKYEHVKRDVKSFFDWCNSYEKDLLEAYQKNDFIEEFIQHIVEIYDELIAVVVPEIYDFVFYLYSNKLLPQPTKADFEKFKKQKYEILRKYNAAIESMIKEKYGY